MLVTLSGFSKLKSCKYCVNNLVFCLVKKASWISPVTSVQECLYIYFLQFVFPLTYINWKTKWLTSSFLIVVHSSGEHKNLEELQILKVFIKMLKHPFFLAPELKFARLCTPLKCFQGPCSSLLCWAGHTCLGDSSKASSSSPKSGHWLHSSPQSCLPVAHAHRECL